MTTSDEEEGISPKQLAFLLVDTTEALYGGAAGGGKSEALLIGALQDVEDHPVSSLLLRLSFRDLDKYGGLMHRAREWLTPTDAHWDGINKRWNFPSGAALSFGFIDHEGDELKFQSSEYQYVGFDELTHFPEHHYLYLFSRLRRLKGTQIPLRMRAGTNPGGPGHEWVRKRWNLPTGTHPSTGRVFVSADLYDNPFLEHDEYVSGLDQLGDVTRAQLLGGDWTATSSGGFLNVQEFIVVPWERVPPANEIAAIVRYWDFAATEPTELNPDPDYTVGCKVAMTVDRENGLADWYVLDVKRFRGGPGEVERQVAATALLDGPRVVQWLEQERGAAGKLLYNHYATDVLPNSVTRPLYATGTKPERAAVAAARVSEGRVYLVEGEWVDDFRAECGVFPMGGHDDQVDGFANALISINKERLMVAGGSVSRIGKKMKSTFRNERSKRRQPMPGHYGY